MEIRQLTIWDNLALENGTRCLSALQFEEALEHFSKAIKQDTADAKSIEKLVEACMHWQSRTHNPEQPESQAGYIEDFLMDYGRYPFSPGMTGLKKRLLLYILSLMQDEPAITAGLAETAFDLCLSLKEYGQAENLVNIFNRNNPKNRISQCLLAQAQWLQENFYDAGRNYAQALLRYPDALPISRIENRALRDLILTVGPELAPAYALIRNILPATDLTGEIIAGNPVHQKALRSYRLLTEAQEALNRNDMKASVNFRKQLKALEPELYNEYFKWLKQHK
jgi:hypothetical protein